MTLISPQAFDQLPAAEDALWVGPDGVGFDRQQPNLPDWLLQEGGEVGDAVLFWPRAKAEALMWLHLLGARLKMGGKLWVYGHNRQGIRSAQAVLQELFGNAVLLSTRAHGRLLQVVKHGAVDRGSLADWVERVEIALPAHHHHAATTIALQSYPGSFAHGRLDAGTAFLLEHLPPQGLGAKDCVLDYACGNGVIAAALHHWYPATALVLADIDSLALHAAQQNMQDNAAAVVAVVHADHLGALPPEFLTRKKLFKAIFSNPPIHQGGQESMEILHRLVMESPRYLTPDGALYLVMQHRLNLQPLLQTAFANAELLASNGSYKLWRGSKTVA